MEPNFELDMIYGTQLDCRGDFFDDDVPESPVEEFRKAQADEMSKKQAGVVALSVIVPTFEHVLGLRSEQDIVLKADEPVEHIEDNSLRKNAELSPEDEEWAREMELSKAMWS